LGKEKALLENSTKGPDRKRKTFEKVDELRYIFIEELPDFHTRLVSQVAERRKRATGEI